MWRQAWGLQARAGVELPGFTARLVVGRGWQECPGLSMTSPGVSASLGRVCETRGFVGMSSNRSIQEDFPRSSQAVGCLPGLVL